MSTKFMYFLLDGNPDSPLTKSYWSTYHCSHELVVNDAGHLVGKYCKQRWCLTCNRIRTAISIVGYGPQLQELKDLRFMTLTMETCREEELPGRIKQVEKIWASILACNRKACQRGRGRVLIGVRKCECTGRPDGYYHYHFHVLISGLDNARWLLDQWKTRVAAAGIKVSGSAQDIRKADEGSLQEVFKYATKIVTKQKGKDDYLATAQQLDWIFQCLKGKRTFQPFGGLRAVDEEFEDDQLIGQPVPGEFEGLVWTWWKTDWVSEYGELLTGYVPSKVDEGRFQLKTTTLQTLIETEAGYAEEQPVRDRSGHVQPCEKPPD